MMLEILIFTWLLFKASASKISDNGTTVAEYGGEAQYRCTLANQTGVLQVTWQRLFKDGSIENLATYSKRFGQQVNVPYLGKVIFTEASLISTAITLRNVTWQDEGCYVCSFNVYPDGSKRKQTCLDVQGISLVDTSNVRSRLEGEDAEVVFSCSATGKPAPTIDWDISPGATRLDQTQVITLTNSDHTFTSSKNITLRFPPDWKGDVICLLNGERRERIPFSTEPRNPKNKNGDIIGIMSVVLICCIAAAAAAALVMWRKRLQKSRRNENVL